MKIRIEDLPALSLGAGVLGTGGGGIPYTGRLALTRQIEQTGREPELIDVDSLADDALLVSVCMAGSPSIGMEKLLADTYISAPLRAMERRLGRRVDAIIPLEVGGVNSLLPLMTACVSGLPVVDGDGMGRAFPTIDKTTFGIGGVSPCPNILVNPRGDVVIVDQVVPEQVEKISREIIVALGGHCASASYPMTGAQAKRLALRGTMSLALRIGHSILDARHGKRDPAQAILDEMRRLDPPIEGRVLFDGKIVDLKRETAGGYNIGGGTIEGGDGFTGSLTFAFQNEFLHARHDGRLLAIVPDLIIMLDRETAEPITCEALRYGQRVKLLGIPCFPALRTEAAMRVCGPRAFGLHDAYVPVEQSA